MKRYALVVGINDYEDEESIRSLRFAVQDARQVDRFFHDCGFDVQALMDSEATCAAIERHLREFSERLRPDDVFLFYFSGHGYQWGAPGEERQYLLPRDADLWALKHGGAGRAVPMRLVQESSGDRGARRVVVLDACRAGVSPGEKGETATEERLAAKDIRAVAAAARASSPLIVVCSCHPRQLSYEHGGLHGGLFTAAMLSVFSNLRNEGRPIAFTTEANSAISQRMKRLAADHNLDAGKIGDFWVEGDATSVELVPASRPHTGQAVPTGLPPAPAPTIQAGKPAAGNGPVESGTGPGRSTPSAQPFRFQVNDKTSLTAHSVEELFDLCRRYPVPAARHLYEGHFERWLAYLGERALAERAAVARGQAMDRRAGLEEFLAGSRPLVLRAGTVLRTVEDLRQAAGLQPFEVAHALYLGRIEDWLAYLGQARLASKAQQIRLDQPDTDAGLKCLFDNRAYARFRRQVRMRRLAEAMKAALDWRGALPALVVVLLGSIMAMWFIPAFLPLVVAALALLGLAAIGWMAWRRKRDRAESGVSFEPYATDSGPYEGDSMPPPMDRDRRHGRSRPSGGSTHKS